MFKTIYIRNFRNGWATNSSSTHSVIYKNKDEMLNDLNVMELNYYDRATNTIAASKEAKIKYVAFNMWWHDGLMRTLCAIYPTMQQYVELMQEQEKKLESGEIEYEDRKYGMYVRGNLSFGEIDNFESALDFIRKIIDNDNIAIVGGSDELDFVYDTLEDHIELECPAHDSKVVKNGNYWVNYDSFGKRLRFSIDDKPLKPDYPELIDLHITNKCQHNCSFCYQNSTDDSQHADIKFIKELFWNVHDFYPSEAKIEFAIGGGNILLYPHLMELFEFLTGRGHIINTTLNAKDLPTLSKNKEMFDLFNKNVKGVGISVSTMEDVFLAQKFAEEHLGFTKDLINYVEPDADKEFKPYCVVHLIPEYLGLKKSVDYINRLREYYSFLFLGYKRLGRGITMKTQSFTETELKILCNRSRCLSIDTCFANTYKDFLVKNFATENTITYYEGEFSMYVDAVNKKAYKSSYQKEKAYNLYGDEYANIPCTFAQIRKDNNLD